jgi:predicted enzyme related to lactoylglutathione lyase
MIRYVHTNLIAKDWKKLASFYERIFGCIPIPPNRDLSGEWLDKATDIDGAHIRGIHLRLPGYPENGPTLEIFEYGDMPERPQIDVNTPGFSHIAFSVDDVNGLANRVVENGGSTIGDFTHKEVEGVGRLTFQYVTDPEGNIIELQSWSAEGT